MLRGGEQDYFRKEATTELLLKALLRIDELEVRLRALEPRAAPANLNIGELMESSFEDV